MEKVKRHIVSLLLGAVIITAGLLFGGKTVAADEVGPVTISAEYVQGLENPRCDPAEKKGIGEYVSIYPRKINGFWNEISYDDYHKCWNFNGSSIINIAPKQDIIVKIDCENAVLYGNSSDAEYTTDVVADYSENILDENSEIYLSKDRTYTLRRKSSQSYATVSALTFIVDNIVRNDYSAVAITSISSDWIDEEYDYEYTDFGNPLLKYMSSPKYRGHFEVTVNASINLDGFDYIDVSAINAANNSPIETLRNCKNTGNGNSVVFNFYPVDKNTEITFVASAGRYGIEEKKTCTEGETRLFNCLDIPLIQSVRNVGNKDAVSAEIKFKNVNAEKYRFELYHVREWVEDDINMMSISKSETKTIETSEAKSEDENLVYTWDNIGVDAGKYYVGVVGIADGVDETPLIMIDPWEENSEGNLIEKKLNKFGEYSITCDDATSDACNVHLKMYPDEASKNFWMNEFGEDEEFFEYKRFESDDMPLNAKASDGCNIVFEVSAHNDEEYAVKTVIIKYYVNGEEKTETLTREIMYDEYWDENRAVYKFIMPASNVVISADLVQTYHIGGNSGMGWYCAEYAYSGQKVTLNYDEDTMYEIVSAFYVLASDYDVDTETYTKKTDILVDEDGFYSFIMPNEPIIIFTEEKQIKVKTELIYSNANIILGTNDDSVTIRRYNTKKHPEIDPTDAKRHPYAAFVAPGKTGILNVSTLDAGYKVIGEIVSSKTPDVKTKLISKNGKLALSIPAGLNCEVDYNTLTLSQEKANTITLAANADLATFVADDILALKGEKITVTAVAGDGKKLEEIKVNPSVEVKAGARENEYEFIMPDGAVTISAVTSDMEPKKEEQKTVEIKDDVIVEDTSYEGIKGVTRTDLSGATVTVKDQNYTGDFLKPAVTVSLVENGKTVKLVEGTDYIKTYDNNKNAGTAKVVITGSGLYKGTAEKTFTIKAKAIKNTKYTTEIAMTSDSIASLTDRIVIYDGVVKLEAGKDYKVDTSAIEVLKKGKVKVKIEGINNYTGSANASISVIEPVEKQFMIRKAELKPEKANQLIYNGKNHKFLTSDLVVRSESGEIVPETAYTVSAKNVKNVGEGVITIKAKGRDYKGSVVVPFEIKPETITFTVDAVKDVTYNGKLQRPKTKVKAVVNGREVTLKLNKDYKVTYKDNLNAGVAGYTITGMGNFVAAKESAGSFTIKPLEIRKAKIKGNKTAGLELTYNKRKLVEGVDYELSAWEDDANGRNKSTVTITGKRNFDKTTVTKTFKIK